jgi:uncharacterized protein YcnI
MRSTSAVLSGAALTLLLTALPAAAHVTVHSTDATPGGNDAEIVFRVPNEEGSAKTTKVEIALPADEPITGVNPENKPGWTVATKSTKLATPIQTDDGTIDTAVVSVTWTATTAATPPGGYDDFSLAAGQLPDTDAITFKAVQTYSDGSVVRWIETGSDSEHPAPVLALKGATTPTASAGPTATATQAPVVTTKDDSTAKALGGAGLGLGVVALLVAAGALVRSGRRTTNG